MNSPRRRARHGIVGPDSILRLKRGAGFLCLILCLFVNAESEAARGGRRGGERYRSDNILIKTKEGSSAALELLHAKEGIVPGRRFSRAGNIRELKLPRGANVAAILERYRRSGHVEVAEPDYWIEAAANPNDPYYQSGLQWGLHNYGQSGGGVDADIDAPQAWDSSAWATDIVVAVVDSGVRASHEDLAANMWVNPGEIPGNAWDDDLNGIVDDVHGFNAVDLSGEIDDVLGHGTKIAGVLGAVGNNGMGVAGVAWGVKIMACRFMDDQGNGTVSDAIACIDYARNHGARVINASFVTPADSALLEAALLACQMEGIIVVAAAGNSGTDNDLTPHYPASYDLDNIVTVTGTTRTDAFSGYNVGLQSVDLAAPGVAVFSTAFSSDSAYGYESGTSIATPFVAGSIALLLVRYPSDTYGQIIDRLLNATDPLPSLAGKCLTGGRLNLARALGALTGPAPCLAGASGPAPGQFQLQITGPPYETFLIEYSLDWADWQPAATVKTGGGGTVNWIDQGAGASGQRFYRTVQ